jgi:unsaturated rhamnogalacturonyl hydrolase
LVVCKQLAAVYGHELPSLAYIPAVACIGRLRLAELTGDKSVRADIQRITADYFSGAKPTLTEQSNGNEIAGHILWNELLIATGDRAYVKLAQLAADRAFAADGQPLEAMPYHNEMSDAVFMSCPILAQVGTMTGDNKYYDMCLRHLRFMLKLNLRSDGLHRHSPLHETAWGRGNGFPALGLALSLEQLPESHPGRNEMLEAFRTHMTALLAHQDVTGAWHQVVDHPESYRELTSTCMITYAMLRGMRRGWLPRDPFQPAIERGWKAVKARVASDGSLVDVCTGTGKQKSLRDYFDRTAILGQDPRGGAMALLLATEVAAWEAEK